MDTLKKIGTTSLQEWARMLVQVVGLFLLVRFVFFLEILFRFNADLTKTSSMFVGSFYDILLSCSVAVVVLVPLAIIKTLFPKVGRFFQCFFVIGYLLLSFILTEYFYNVGAPLDHVIFAYTPRNILDTVLWSTSVSFTSVLFFVLYIALGIIFFIATDKKTFAFVPSIVCLLATIVVFCCVKYKNLVREEWLFESSHTDFLYAVNQPSYTIVKILDFKEKDKDSYTQMQNVAKATEVYHTKNNKTDYIDSQYPFMRKFTDADVLGAFMKTSSRDTLPNFVFIIVESLGQYLTCVDSTSLSFTTFLDSLKQKSLYWPNCVSTTERTFGVMPAVFASVPQGRKGFANEWLPIPEYNSLLKEFHDNGYYLSFFYGGAASFGGQNAFMKANGVDYISDVTLDTMTEARSSLQKEFYRWGVDDSELFDFAERIKGQQNTNPFVDIYLTLSSHEPFEIPNIDTYRNKILKNWHIDETTKEGKIVKDNLNIFSCYLYTDESLRQLFNYYKTRDDYDNTIFIVTGDHRTGKLGNPNIPIQKYNVPLIIYSPLLCRIKTMEGVVSHYDITPSVSSFLKHNYSFDVPNNCHWLGTAFDTSESFQCNKRQAFMLNNTDVVEYLFDTVYLAYGRLYSVQRGLRLKQIENEELLDDMQTFLTMYQTLSEYTLYKNKLLKPTTTNKK